MSETAIELGLPLQDLLSLSWPAFLVVARTLGPCRAAEDLRATQVALYPHLPVAAQRAYLRDISRNAKRSGGASRTANAEQVQADADHVKRQVAAFLETGSTLYGGGPGET